MCTDDGFVRAVRVFRKLLRVRFVTAAASRTLRTSVFRRLMEIMSAHTRTYYARVIHRPVIFDRRRVGNVIVSTFYRVYCCDSSRRCKMQSIVTGLRCYFDGFDVNTGIPFRRQRRRCYDCYGFAGTRINARSDVLDIDVGTWFDTTILYSAVRNSGGQQ